MVVQGWVGCFVMNAKAVGVETWNLKVESSSPGHCTHLNSLSSTLVYKWEPTNCFGDNRTNFWEITCDGLVSHTAILRKPVTSAGLMGLPS